jgi:hypothetical protein
MTRKLLVSRLGAGSITLALCAALPGCNLAAWPENDCVGRPSSRGMSTAECRDDAAATDGPGDAAADTNAHTAGDTAGGQGAADGS